MKFGVSIILTFLLSLACGIYLPWWSIALAGFIVHACIAQRPLAAFLSGFIGVFLLWLILAVSINTANEGILAPKVSLIMGFGQSSFMLILLTAILGGVCGGLGSLTGSLCTAMIRKE